MPEPDRELLTLVFEDQRDESFDATDAPIDYAREWLEGYAFRLEQAERVKHYPKSTKADYGKALNWAADPRRDRRHEARDVLLDQIKQHPNPPYSPEVLIVEYASLFQIPVEARLRDDFPSRFRAWLDRAESFLSIGASVGKTTAIHAPALTADHEAILAVLAKAPSRCMTVNDVVSVGPIRNRETAGRLLRELAGFGLVHRPHGKRKGYALTSNGITRANALSATT